MGLQVVTMGDDGTVQASIIRLPADSTIGGSAVVALGTITSASATAFTGGRQGTTDPALNIKCDVASCVTGINITARAAAAGVDITTTSSGTNENIRIDAKGSGTLLLQGTATGALLVGDATNPSFGVTHTTEGTGWNITTAAAASGVSLTVTSSGTDEAGKIDSKGAGTLTFNGTATGAIIAGRQLRYKVVTVPVAAAGTVVGDAGQLAAANIVHVTCDGAGKAVKLATGVMGDEITVINDSATACELYAASGGTVNGLSADASVVVPASKGLWLQCTAADTWIAFDLPAKATAS